MFIVHDEYLTANIAPYCAFEGECGLAWEGHLSDDWHEKLLSHQSFPQMASAHSLADN